MAILQDIRALTGRDRLMLPRISPLLVIAGGLPMSPAMMRYVNQQLEGQGLLQDPRVDRLGIVDLEELDLMINLSMRNDRTPVELLRDWQASGLAEVGFKTFAFDALGGLESLERSPEAKERIDATFKLVMAALDLQEGEVSPPPPADHEELD